jgi:hypothetical protein
MTTKIIKQWVTKETKKDDETGDVTVLSETHHAVKKIDQRSLYESETVTNEPKKKRRKK